MKYDILISPIIKEDIISFHTLFLFSLIGFSVSIFLVYKFLILRNKIFLSPIIAALFVILFLFFKNYLIGNFSKNSVQDILIYFFSSVYLCIPLGFYIYKNKKIIFYNLVLCYFLSLIVFSFLATKNEKEINSFLGIQNVRSIE